MSQSISRRKIAETVAVELLAGDAIPVVMERLAAYLIVEKRTTEYELLVRDIEAALAARGTVIADVTTVSALTAAARTALQEQLGGAVQLREHSDPTVLGGVKLELPGRRLDATLERKIATLTTLKA